MPIEQQTNKEKEEGREREREQKQVKAEERRLFIGLFHLQLFSH